MRDGAPLDTHLVDRSGCSQCQGSKDGLEQVSDELRDRAFQRVTFYQNDLLYRCPLCGTAWLHQYWEIDTPETALDEFGERHWEWIALTDDDVAEIEQAEDASRPLAHDRFRA